MVPTLDLAASSSDPHTRRTLSNLSLSVAKSKRIVVVTGAGISCSCGIPVRELPHAVVLILARSLIRARRIFVLLMDSMLS
jgi:hypothetical protein